MQSDQPCRIWAGDGFSARIILVNRTPHTYAYIRAYADILYVAGVASQGQSMNVVRNIDKTLTPLKAEGLKPTHRLIGHFLKCLNSSVYLYIDSSFRLPASPPPAAVGVSSIHEFITEPFIDRLSVHPILLIANKDVSRTKMCLDTSILTKSNMRRREY
jgi:hypothetical protein